MILEELILEQTLKGLERVDPARVAFIDAEMARRRGGLRRAAAATLVRLGISLDRDAGERAASMRHRAPRGERTWS
ncbi:MAG TPA: hypothetical protein VEZ14_11315 [Dehalococcoidia bacterium]|nr:hypothetical protein [Dehalococcoidia bacterium]